MLRPSLNLLFTKEGINKSKLHVWNFESFFLEAAQALLRPSLNLLLTKEGINKLDILHYYTGFVQGNHCPGNQGKVREDEKGLKWSG